jgi:hypothetical protein
MVKGLLFSVPCSVTVARLTDGSWWTTLPFLSPFLPALLDQPLRSPVMAQVAAMARAVLPAPLDDAPANKEHHVIQNTHASNEHRVACWGVNELDILGARKQ